MLLLHDHQYCGNVRNSPGRITQFLHDHQHTVGTGQYRTRLAIHLPLDMGIKGAAIATSISGIPGMVLVAWYFWGHSNQLRLYRPKFSQTALHLTARNCGYMLRLGFPTFIAETAICCMIITGNYMFIGRLHEDGVAAFSVACYLFPMIFMFGNAIAQTALPIVSYNYGKGNQDRIRQTLHISAGLSVGLGLVMTTRRYPAGATDSQPLHRRHLTRQRYRPCGFAALPDFQPTVHGQRGPHRLPAKPGALQGRHILYAAARLRAHHPQFHPASRVTWQHRTLARRDRSRDTDTCRPHRIPTVEPEIKRHQQETKESQTKAKPIL